jgi:precorrin-6A/cobalt-precorrin-6A reductase
MERPAWTPQRGDDWFSVPDIAQACVTLCAFRRAFFLAIRRMHVVRPPTPAPLCAAVVDAPHKPFLLFSALIIARGRLTWQAISLMREYHYRYLVAKNAGVGGAVAKLTAARALECPH